MLPMLGEVEHRVVQRRLAGADAQRLDAAFERGDAPLEHRGGRIADAAVAEALDLEIEQRGAVIGAVELVGDGLVDRHRDGFGRRIDLVAAVHGDRFSLRIVPPRIPNARAIVWRFGFLSVAAGMNIASKMNWKQ